jgi:hypothetical protein
MLYHLTMVKQIIGIIIPITFVIAIAFGVTLAAIGTFGSVYAQMNATNQIGTTSTTTVLEEEHHNL